MKKVFFVIFILLSFNSLSAKRAVPKEVQSIEYQGLRYVAIECGWEVDIRQNGGIIEIWDIEKNVLIKRKIIYRIRYNPFIERDVQDIFITKLDISEDGNFLIITDEKERIYYMNLRNFKVHRKRG
ncbi:MAG: hypothetical protein JXR63_07795 [Spirochaetales bacterium]|nr:hypothetical protein [Spirochaetales bacterium]